MLGAGTQGAVASMNSAGTATTLSLLWDGTSWTANAGGGQTQIIIDAANSDEKQVQFTIWEDDAGLGAPATTAEVSVISYTFEQSLSSAGGDSITFTIDPHPPEEFPEAVLSTSGASPSGIGIDWDGRDSVDMQFNPTAGGGAVTAGMIAVFDVDPNVPPGKYPNATLTGDQTKAIIDLDDSGGGSDDDIVFTFDKDLKYGSQVDLSDDDARSAIRFEILGSTAWTNIEDSDLTNDGYFNLITDFLGGAYGSTEMNIKMDLGSSFDGNNWLNDSLSTTQYSKSSSTTYQDSDGYAAGDLEGVEVGSDGTMTGAYSNGQLIPLFRIGLAKFYNNYGLHAEGGNLFSETNESGQAITNKPGENGLGTIAPNSLEMSNVDIADQLVKMIEIQRGYQGNSKTITTVDEMLQTVINMK